MPEAKLNSPHVRSILKTCIIDQLITMENMQFVTFRMVWVRRDDAERDLVWNSIFDIQQEFCNILKGLPGLHFFLSSVTATWTKATKRIHPAVVFWAAKDPFALEDLQMYSSLRNKSFGSELKFVNMKGANAADFQLNHLCIALKDFGPGWVQQKLDYTVGNQSYLRDRIYCKKGTDSFDFFSIFENAVYKLGSHGLNIHLETF